MHNCDFLHWFLSNVVAVSPLIAVSIAFGGEVGQKNFAKYQLLKFGTSYITLLNNLCDDS